MDSGFGEEDAYNVYDQPWRKTDAVSSMYRPSKNLDKDNYGDDIETLMKTNKYVYFDTTFVLIRTSKLIDDPR